jgi:hypothetical protein
MVVESDHVLLEEISEALHIHQRRLPREQDSRRRCGGDLLPKLAVLRCDLGEGVERLLLA